MRIMSTPLVIMILITYLLLKILSCKWSLRETQYLKLMSDNFIIRVQQESESLQPDNYRFSTIRIVTLTALFEINVSISISGKYSFPIPLLSDRQFKKIYFRKFTVALKVYKFTVLEIFLLRKIHIYK
jgi:hypothetical protein